MIDLPDPIAVACHDAGAANLILAWLAAQPQLDVRPVMEGPAARLWAGRFPDRPTLGSLEDAMNGAASLLSGTGWGSVLEHEARRLAKTRGLPSAAVIDHWVNYPQRFERGGETVWPDAFWVTDDMAAGLARRAFPGGTVRLKPNLYLDEQLAAIARSGSEPAGILYVLEPARSGWGRGQAGEFQALDYFFSNLAALGVASGTPVRLRPHPSDPPGKYAGWAGRRNGVTVAIDASDDLAEAIAGAEWVAGCESFALVVALAAGRKVVCTLPPWAPQCALPHAGLIHLKAIA